MGGLKGPSHAPPLYCVLGTPVLTSVAFCPLLLHTVARAPDYAHLARMHPSRLLHASPAVQGSSRVSFTLRGIKGGRKISAEFQGYCTV